LPQPDQANPPMKEPRICRLFVFWCRQAGAPRRRVMRAVAGEAVSRREVAEPESRAAVAARFVALAAARCSFVVYGKRRQSRGGNGVRAQPAIIGGRYLLSIPHQRLVARPAASSSLGA